MKSLKAGSNFTLKNGIFCPDNGEGLNWWDISSEPEPFSAINDLAKYIGAGDEEAGISELIDILRVPISKLHENIHIGLRFPSRWLGRDIQLREKDWQMFRLKKGSREFLVTDTDEELQERLQDYTIEAVYQEYLTEQHFHMRNLGRANRTILKNKAVSIIGCGALGSETSDALNKAGIGKILLIDKDKIRAQNTMRHCLGLDKISLPKVLGMHEYLSKHNPFVNIMTPESGCFNVLSCSPDNYLPKNFIGISTIADDNIEAYINEQAVNEKRIVFYCRALRGGKAARIFRVIPEKDACKACLSLYRADNDPIFKAIDEDESLPAITNECNNPIRPASAADLKIIAGIFARIVIDYLQEFNLDKNHWIWSTESLEKLELSDSSQGCIHNSQIPPHPKCPICKKLEDRRVYINSEAYNLIKEESATSEDIETGGVLMGHIDKNGDHRVEKATKPGPNAIRTKDRFERDIDFCQAELKKASKELGEKGIYLGEWHYHPIGSNDPSGIDIKSLAEIAAQKNYHINKPVMIIISPSLEFAITIHDEFGHCVKLSLEVIKDE